MGPGFWPAWPQAFLGLAPTQEPEHLQHQQGGCLGVEQDPSMMGLQDENLWTTQAARAQAKLVPPFFTGAQESVQRQKMSLRVKRTRPHGCSSAYSGGTDAVWAAACGRGMPQSRAVLVPRSSQSIGQWMLSEESQITSM